VSTLHIGIDLDNTIIDYSDVFAPVASELGLLPESHGLRTKKAVKEHLLARAGDESLWMRLQGQIYGRFIALARPYPGVIAAIDHFRSQGHRLSIVSHKTRHGHFDVDAIDLWDAALGWLERQEITGSSDAGARIIRSDVHFRVTRDEKIAQIDALDISVFIDDLPEVLSDPAFPPQVRRILFSPDGDPEISPDWAGARSWQEVVDRVALLV
jgi:hypothetical protein